MSGRVLLDQTIVLGPNQEQHFGPISYLDNWKLILSSSGTVRHYLGLFDQAEYARLTSIRTAAGRFPFVFGTDRTGHLLYFNTQSNGQLYVVVRVGVFNPQGTIRVRLEC